MLGSDQKGFITSEDERERVKRQKRAIKSIRSYNHVNPEVRIHKRNNNLRFVLFPRGELAV